jgi:hypothetical protein
MMAKRPKPRPVKIVEEGKKSITLDVVFKRTKLDPDSLENYYAFFFQQITVKIISAKKWDGLTLTKLSNHKVFLKSELQCTEVDLVEGTCDAVEIEFSKKKKLTNEEAKELYEKNLARFFGSENFAEEGEYLGKF